MDLKPRSAESYLKNLDYLLGFSRLKATQSLQLVPVQGTQSFSWSACQRLWCCPWFQKGLCRLQSRQW